MAQKQEGNTFFTGVDIYNQHKNEDQATKKQTFDKPKIDTKDEEKRVHAETAFKQIVSKVSFADTGVDYSDYKVKPGFDFWRLLAKSSQKKLDQLKVKIPDTFVMIDPTSVYLRYDKHKKKIVKMAEDVTFQDFEDNIKNTDPHFCPPEYNKDDQNERVEFIKEMDKRYFVCKKQKSGNSLSFNMPSDLLTLPDWKNKPNSEKQKLESILQKFIYPVGQPPKGQKACITRLVYKTKHNKGDMSNKKDPNRIKKKKPFKDGDTFEYKYYLDHDVLREKVMHRKFRIKFLRNEENNKLESIQMVEDRKLIWECFEPHILLTGTNVEVNFYDDSIIPFEKSKADRDIVKGDDGELREIPYKAVELYMPDVWTIRPGFKSDRDFVNDDKPYIDPADGPLNKNLPKLQSSYAYKIQNEAPQITGKQGSCKSAVIDFRNTEIGKNLEHPFKVYQITGQALKEYEAIAESLVEFLERNGVRIMLIVQDFITDNNNNHWLFNLKHIELDTNVKVNEDHVPKSTDDLTCSVYCKLCNLIFKKDEASKTLTYKLLWEFCQHLKKRGEDYYKHFEVSHSSTRPCRVCDLCYMVVVSEHELIELEQQFARIQNIPIKDPYMRVPVEKKAKHRPALLPAKLEQWRLMLYFESLSFDDGDDQLEYPGIFEELKGQDKEIHLQVKISNIRNDFHIKIKKVIETSDDFSGGELERPVYELNILRVYYYFSEKTDIKKFLNETDIQIRLTYSQDWNDYIAHGSTKTLNQFQNNRR